MSPLLLAPLGLAALVALAVPLLVHLRRRTEQVSVDFAALRWLAPRPRPRRQVRFDEWLLLALRLLLVTALALLLARPAAFGLEEAGPRVLVAPGVDARAARRFSTSLETNGVEGEARWLAPGFPALDTPAPAGPVPLASLIRQYDAELPAGAALTIVVPAVVAGLDAAPLRLTRAVTWRVMPGAMAVPDAARTRAPGLAVRHDGGGAVRYFRAAAAAWGSGDRFAASGDEALPADGAVLVWLKRTAPPASVSDWIARGGTALFATDSRWTMPAATTVVWRDAGGQALAEAAPLGRGRVVRLTRALAPAAFPELLDPDFPAQLRALVTAPAPPPDRVRAVDVAPVAGVASFPLPPRELTPWLALLIAALFVIERWVAAGRRRA